AEIASASRPLDPPQATRGLRRRAHDAPADLRHLEIPAREAERSLLGLSATASPRYPARPVPPPSTQARPLRESPQVPTGPALRLYACVRRPPVLARRSSSQADATGRRSLRRPASPRRRARTGRAAKATRSSSRGGVAPVRRAARSTRIRR